MHSSIALFLISAVAVANASNLYSVTFFSGTSCTGSASSFIATDGHSCNSIPGGADSMLVDTLSGCSTNFFASNDCSGSGVHVDEAQVCNGFSDGSRLGSYTTDC
ncbi:hypothetical protein BU16DRAFT_580806 [Lophium mytilinum]|uniref:Uncharacterized protein n=1 Tax=Lophium mytilinum TaxID=390894 RepID=A0A6A6QW92_9PEZI|nr:hypothetical protein BU16DRAFT_580806 [Lophium mytilinum]